MKQNKFSLTDGLFRNNAVLSEGMVIAPIVICCDTLKKALLLSFVFAFLTVLTVWLGSLYPRKLAYAVRIVLYALTAAVLYIPAAALAQLISPETYAALSMMQLPGIEELSPTAVLYLPLLTVNSFIVLHSEFYFYRLTKFSMLPVLVFHVAGFCMTACLVGCIRELLAYGSILGHVVDMPLLLQGSAAPWAGFVIVGILCALHRVIFPKKEE